MNFKQIILDDLVVSLKKCGLSADNAQVNVSGKPELADYQTNVAFTLAKQARIAPNIIAQKIMENLPSNNYYQVSFAAPAYINFRLTDECLNKYAEFCLNSPIVGLKKLDNPRTIFMDYGGANVAKELHIGHLRSPIIGESINRLHKLLGDNVISDVYLGDWGTQMGLNIAQLEDDGVLDYYFGKSDKKIEITLEMLNKAYPKASLRKKTDPEFKKRAEDYTLFVQSNQEPYFGIYKQIKEVSLVRIKQNYLTLGCNFDLWNGESNAQPYVKPTIEIFKQKGLAKLSNGALIVDVSLPGENQPSGKFDQNGKELLVNPMPPLMLQKANGGDIYDTTEIATLNMRYQKFKPDEFIYVVDNRQSQHFTLAFRAVKMAEIIPQNTKLTHISYGTINGKDGKAFKTRSGDTIKLEDIINLITDSAKKKLAENGITETGDLALQIGLAALKYSDLSCTCSRDYIFDIDKFASFEGKTGPYIQYTGTRIKSLLNKANIIASNVNISTAEERDLILSLAKLNDSYYDCYNDYSLNYLCNSLYNFCANFSRFYNNNKILTEQNLGKKQSYLAICNLCLKAIEQAAYTLGFIIPDKM